MRWKRMTVMLVGTAVVFGGVYGFVKFRENAIADFFANQPVPVIQVTASEATAEEWTTTIPTVGSLKAASGVNVTASVPGIVQEIHFESGQRVSRGQALVDLDADIEQANLDAARADSDLARANYERVQALPAGSVVSQATLDQNLFQMQAREAQVASLQAQIDKKTVRAPFEGVLGIRRVDIGEYIQPGTAIVNLQDLSSLRVEFSVSQRDLSNVQPGRKIRVVADVRRDHVYEGVVTSVEPEVDAATGLVRAEGTLPNPDGQLVAGTFVNVEVELADSEEVVVIPQSAVSYNLYGDFVYVIDPPAEGEEHPKVRRVVVSTGARRDGMVVVAEGVSAGDQIVTSGQLRLSNGTQVEVSDQPLGQPDVTNQPY